MRTCGVRGCTFVNAYCCSGERFTFRKRRASYWKRTRSKEYSFVPTVPPRACGLVWGVLYVERLLCFAYLVEQESNFSKVIRAEISGIDADDLSAKVGKFGWIG